jgi:hypothetical protein
MYSQKKTYYDAFVWPAKGGLSASRRYNRRMKRLPELIDQERDRLQAEKLERVTREAENYWNDVAPCGALPGKLFTLADGVELLLYDLRRYQAAVAAIFEREQDQKALLDHKAATGQECETDRQRWLAYLEMTHAITAALQQSESV